MFDRHQSGIAMDTGSGTVVPVGPGNVAARFRTHRNSVSPSPRAVVLFTRAPEAEARAKHLPLAPGVQLFSGLLAGWRQAAAEALADLVICTPESSVSRLTRAFPGATFIPQQGNSFAARLENAFAQTFAYGIGSALLVGGDCPPMALQDLRSAFAHLESHQEALVLAPADDGGVNAIGFSAGAHRPLSGIPWFTEDVCLVLQAAGKRSGLSVLLTAAGWDLDTASGVRLLYRLSLAQSSWSIFRWILRALLHQAAATIRNSRRQLQSGYRQANPSRGPPTFALVNTTQS